MLERMQWIVSALLLGKNSLHVAEEWELAFKDSKAHTENGCRLSGLQLWGRAFII